DPAQGPPAGTPAVAPPPVALPLPGPLTLALSTDWVRPQTSLTAEASGPDGVAYAWFLELYVPPAAPEASSGGETARSAGPTGPTLQHGPGSDPLQPHAHGEGNHSPLDAPGPAERPPLAASFRVAPGDAPVALSLAAAGLHRFAIDDGPLRLNVTVSPTGPQEASVSLHDTGAGLSWFVPSEATVAPGGRLTFTNNGTAAHTVAERAFLWQIPGEGPAVEVTPQETGDFDLVVIATAASGARGEARARLLVDATKPSETEAFGPYRGTIEGAAPAAPQKDAATYQFRAQRAVRLLTVPFTATSSAPAAPQVAVTLLTETGVTVATSAAAASGGLVVEELPSGYYFLSVEAHQGVLIEYVLEPEAAYHLVPPPRTAPADEHAHAH
ncbi:MAG TPA: hypothetical protein VNZ52_11530, partial [Candidatus Thermoplasmatota archaeon]|nr:hypothetical protein [Candidatus Thermoplasmatota archaeon]